MKYQELRDRQQQEVSAFCLSMAFLLSLRSNTRKG